MRFVAVTSCPTGIAHTYMAAEALEQAALAAGHEIVVETQGAAGSDPIAPNVIADADAVIFAADVEVRDRARFDGKPLVTAGVKSAVNDAAALIVEAERVAAQRQAETGESAQAPSVRAATPAAPAPSVGAGTKLRQFIGEKFAPIGCAADSGDLEPELVRIERPQSEGSAVMLEGDADQVAEALHALLIERGLAKGAPR